MTRPFRSAPRIDHASPGERAIQAPFDYASLDARTAQQVRTAAQRIGRLAQQTMEGLLAIGTELLAIKQALPHGRFGPWLKAEFGWSARMARRFRAVAQRFGSKTDRMSVLPIEPTAAYLLAAPSTPEEAIAATIERAQNGECITGAVASEILNSLRKERRRHRGPSPEMPAGKLRGQLLESLESFRQHWNPQQFPLLARQLREFADSLDEEHNRRRAARKP